MSREAIKAAIDRQMADIRAGKAKRKNLGRPFTLKTDPGLNRVSKKKPYHVRQPNLRLAEEMAYLCILSLGQPFPTDPKMALEQLEFVNLYTYKDAEREMGLYHGEFEYWYGNTDGFTVRLDDHSGLQPIYAVAYRPRQLESRNRFTLAHELAHVFMRHKGHAKADELEADHFASCFLAPVAAMQDLPTDRVLGKRCLITAKSAQQARWRRRYKINPYINSLMEMWYFWETNFPKLSKLYRQRYAALDKEGLPYAAAWHWVQSPQLWQEEWERRQARHAQEEALARAKAEKAARKAQALAQAEAERQADAARRAAEGKRKRYDNMVLENFYDNDDFCEDDLYNISPVNLVRRVYKQARQGAQPPLHPGMSYAQRTEKWKEELSGEMVEPYVPARELLEQSILLDEKGERITEPAARDAMIETILARARAQAERVKAGDMTPQPIYEVYQRMMLPRQRPDGKKYRVKRYVKTYLTNPVTCGGQPLLSAPAPLRTQQGRPGWGLQLEGYRALRDKKGVKVIVPVRQIAPDEDFWRRMVKSRLTPVSFRLPADMMESLMLMCRKQPEMVGGRSGCPLRKECPYAENCSLVLHRPVFKAPSRDEEDPYEQLQHMWADMELRRMHCYFLAKTPKRSPRFDWKAWGVRKFVLISGKKIKKAKKKRKKA